MNKLQVTKCAVGLKFILKHQFYEDFQDYEQITKCAVGLKFILKHQERIIEILNNDERYRQLFRTNTT